MEADLHAALAGLAGVGAHEVELAGLHGRSAAAMRSALDAAGLAAVSGHWPLERFEREPEALLEDARTLGTTTLVVPTVPRPRTTAEADALVARIVAAAVAVREAGLGFAYHNHAFEFEPLDDGTDFWSRLTVAGVAHEPDTGWLQVAGRDPVAVLGDLSGRCPLVHAKDVRRAEGGGWEDVPAGDGMSDWPGIAAAAARAGAGRLVVELDHPSADPLDDVVALAGDAPRGARAVGRLTVFAPGPNRAAGGCVNPCERGPRLQRPTPAGHSLTYHAGLGGRRIALKEGHEGPRQGVSGRPATPRRVPAGAATGPRDPAAAPAPRRCSAAGGSCCTR